MKFWEDDLEKYSSYAKDDLKKVFTSMEVIYKMFDTSKDESQVSFRIDSLI